MKSILLIDDDKDFTEVAAHIIEFLGHIVSIAHSVEDAKEWIDNNEYDHVFIDFMLPDGSGLHIFEHLSKKASRLPKCTFITGNPKIKTAIGSIAGPSVDYLMKPIEREDIERALQKKKAPLKAGSKKSVTKGVVQAQSDIAMGQPKRYFDCLVGESAPMQKLYKMIERVARSSANVMLMGESGVGKELVAQAVHNASDNQGDLITTNCGGMSKELIGSELFGHEKGAFTGAIGQKKGVFERAQDGTLFLDEVTEMPIDMQPNLLRVLETKRLNRVGGTQEIPVNCRVVSATNRKLDEIAKENILREDIYFRLAVFPIDIPPLRERKQDIPLLVATFLQHLNAEHGEAYAITDAQLHRLTQHDWPGNVRELRHTLHRAFIMAEPGGKTIELPDSFASPFSQASHSHDNGKALEAGKTIEEVEKALIFATLDEVDGNKTSAAEMLGISTKTLYNRLNAYGESV
ncbi:sigma-54-dependent Fis family transcriptional regulator [Glaciecola sp. MH2013]|uniref:sigma-54-dependent transcriptional regulator n=1 Tax=Glaciecola sp. MH2013 TaxID=2785524 RepID=UPI00189D62CE|nr:sigma-54 dependent transcriptional regulator [Glaciecola sp. MH2013]MBF7073418.1 sigma-54-dependent Fis family transcriptional regulator [Glaciecola sp. MH2013]